MKNKKLVIFFVIIGLVVFINSNQTTDKKEGMSGIFSGAIVMLGGLFLLPTVPFVGWPLLVSGGVLMGGGTAGSLIDMFTPKSTIPGWIWVAGFIILAFMVLRKK